MLVLALGLAVGSAKVFGVSMALGAFLAGMVVGRSEFSLRAATEAMPMRDAFAVLFFVSVGMLLNPAALWNSWGLTVATLAVVLIGKPVAALVIVLALGYPLRVALSVAVALAQIGEFSFILAALGKQLGILPDAATDALVAAAIVSITLNPLLYRLVSPADVWAVTRGSGSGWPRRPKAAAPPGPCRRTTRRRRRAYRAVVVGYGRRPGQTVTRLLPRTRSSRP
ncbi:MAG: cation:proton antiporter [Gemmataceae bacterium]